MSRLIETIRFADGRVENIDYHLRRMNDSSQAIFGDTLHWKPKYVLRDLSLPAGEVHKIRLLYDLNDFQIEASPYTIKKVVSLKLVFDDNLMYDHKFENRDDLERLTATKGDCDDILIIKNNLVTDVSYANIIFRKDNTWFTPDSFLLNGTMRRYLLDRRRITERKIAVDDLREFTHFKLINAMLRDEAPESEVLNIR
jgi:4-amino-4-deoxychorismate lyase